MKKHISLSLIFHQNRLSMLKHGDLPTFLIHSVATLPRVANRLKNRKVVIGVYKFSKTKERKQLTSTISGAKMIKPHHKISQPI